MKALNLTLTFMLELAMLAAFGYFGFYVVSNRVLGVLLAVVLVTAAIAAWSVFAAPRSGRRLAQPQRSIFTVAMFGSASLSLFVSGQTQWAAIFITLTIINQSLALAWKQ